MLHVVDLDGAFDGKPVNLPLIALLRKEISIPIEVGGGFRQMDDIQRAFDHGVDKVILGTSAIKIPSWWSSRGCCHYGGMIAVSIDVSGAFAAASGWKEVSACSIQWTWPRKCGISAWKNFSLPIRSGTAHCWGRILRRSGVFWRLRKCRSRCRAA